MKNNYFFAVLVLVTGLLIVSEPAFAERNKKKKKAQSEQQQSGIKTASAFGQTFDMPLARPDNADYWYEVGVATGTKYNFSDLQDNALLSAQKRIAMKMKHAYKGVVSDYANSYTTKAGTDTQSKMERAGDRIIDAIVGNTDGIDYKQEMDEKGDVTYFVLIAVSKKETVDKIVDAISKDEKSEIDFKEENFRKSAKEKFEMFK